MRRLLFKLLLVGFVVATTFFSSCDEGPTKPDESAEPDPNPSGIPRLIEEHYVIHFFPSGANIGTKYYWYDEQGRLINLIDSIGIWGDTTTYEYGDHQVVEHRSWRGGDFTRTYTLDDNGLATQSTDSNGYTSYMSPDDGTSPAIQDPNPIHYEDASFWYVIQYLPGTHNTLGLEYTGRGFLGKDYHLTLVCYSESTYKLDHDTGKEIYTYTFDADGQAITKDVAGWQKREFTYKYSD